MGGLQLLSGRTSRSTVRPSGSRAAVIDPARLVVEPEPRAFGFRQRRAIDLDRVFFGHRHGGVVSTLPLSFTRPSAIQASASRREQRPARAMTLAMRSPLGGLDGVCVICHDRPSPDEAPFDGACPPMASPDDDNRTPSAGRPWTLRCEEAHRPAQRDEVPVGAVLVLDGQIIAADGNRTRQFSTPRPMPKCS
jgi:hypothetical protein